MATPTTKEMTAVCLITEARKAMQCIGKAAAHNVYDWLTVTTCKHPWVGSQSSEGRAQIN